MHRNLVFIVLCAPSLAYAQGHTHADEHEHPAPAEQHEPPREHHAEDTPLDIPLTRFASGTSWIADESPMRGVHLSLGAWHVMLHGNVFAGYTEQGTDAGDEQLVSQNWAGAMASRNVGGGRLQLRAMGSLEPLTVGDSYPLLLQTGETADGMPLVDRQHPHDLLMEAAISYSRELTDAVAFELYG